MVVTILAVFSALVFGAILILVTSTTVLHAWGRIGSAPGEAFAVSLAYGRQRLFGDVRGVDLQPVGRRSRHLDRARLDRGVLADLRDARLGHAAHARRHGRGDRLQHRRVQHRRPGPVDRRGARSSLRWLRVHTTIWLHLPLVIIAGAVGGALVGFVPGHPEGANRGARGHRDHHAQLHRAVSVGLPAHDSALPATGSVERRSRGSCRTARGSRTCSGAGFE